MDSKEVWHALDTSSAPQAVFECYQTIPPTFPSDNQNQNATPNPSISKDTNCQDVCDLTSNAVINYIGQILLEEDIDDEIGIYEEEAAIRKTEKSFYDLLENEYPLSPTLIEFHRPQNDSNTNSGSSSTIKSVSKNDVPPYNVSEPLLISADPTSALSMENLLATLVQKGAEEVMKFLPPIEKCSSNIREPDLSEGRARKQRAVSADERAGNEFDQVLIFGGSKYVKEVISVRESMKQDVKNKSLEHQVDTSKKETGYGLVNLHSLLINCSEAIFADDYSRASKLIKQIRKHSSLTGDGDQRLACYLVDALEARLAGTGSDIYHKILSRHETVTEYVKAFRVYHAVCPFQKASYYFSIQTILNISKNATKVHIIDFGIHMGFLWPSLFESLSSLGSTPPKIRITGIEFPEKGFRPNKLVEETGRRLSEYAQRFNIRLKYQGIASKWEDIRIEDLKIVKDEILVVNCLFGLRKLADETIAMSCPRDKVLSMIREIKPHVFIHGIHNGSYSTPFYTARFKEVLSKFSSFFDIFESNMPRESEARLHIERTILSRAIINTIACDGLERVERPETYRQWQARNLRAGFVQLPVDSLIKKQIKRTVKGLYHKEYLVDEDNKWLLLGWKGTIIFGLSTWIPNGHENVHCKTK